MVGLPTEHKDPPDNLVGMFHVEQWLGFYIGVFDEFDLHVSNKNLLETQVFHVEHAQTRMVYRRLSPNRGSSIWRTKRRGKRSGHIPMRLNAL